MTTKNTIEDDVDHIHRVNYASLLISLEAAGTALYFMSFTFHLIDRGFSYAFIAWTIASTALVGVFLGPTIGMRIDRSKKKRPLLIVSLLLMGVGIAVQLATAKFDGVFEIVGLLLGIAVFALFYNPVVLLITQYIQPTLKNDTEEAYAAAARIGGCGGVAAAIIGFLLFDIIHPSGLLVLSSLLIFAATFVSGFICSIDVDSVSTDDKKDRFSSIMFIFKVFRRTPFLVLSVVVIAATVDAVGTNIESIIDYLDAFPLRFMFLAAAAEGFLSIAAAIFYSSFYAGMSDNFLRPYISSMVLFLISFTLLFSIFHMERGYITLALFAISYAIASIANCWWGILSVSWIRSSVEDGAFASTMAAIKVPRALVTFIGVGTVGIILDRSGLDGLLLSCIFSMILLIILKLRFDVSVNNDK